MNQLFDKIVNIQFFNKSGVLSDFIEVPATGYKPNITIQGSYITSTVMSEVSLRIINFYPSLSLDQYSKIVITAGYRDGIDKAVIEGQVKVAYQESPSPDGVTFFSFITANATDFLNATINKSYAGYDFGGTETAYDVFNDIVNALTLVSNSQWILNDYFDGTGLLSAPKDLNGSVKDVLAQLKRQWGFIYSIEGNSLNIYSAKQGRTGDVVNINYFSSPPQASAAGITFTAPWMPSLRPGMLVKVDPKYFRQNFGAANVDLQSTLVCQTVEFNFNTVTSQNAMTVLALNTADI